MYSKEEVYKSTLEYFNGDELATDVWIKKYALKDKEGNLLEKTPDDMHRRLAKEFARIEKKYPNSMSEEEIYELLKGFKNIIPQGSPMYGIGNDYANVSLSNCVVIASPEDNMSSIIDKGKELANLFKRRCGVGIDISTLRPDGCGVNNSAGTTTGAWSFSDFYSYVCRMVGQNNRRGALMISMDVRHPDVEKFVVMKQDLKKTTGANVSVKISDEFMKAVEKDGNFELKFPIDSNNPKVSKIIKAKTLWDLIVKSATYTAEPGLIMWDNVRNNLPAECYESFRSVSVNPCQPSWATVLTSNGISTIGEVSEGDFVWSGKRWTKITKKWKTGVKEVFDYSTTAGSFIGTENHRVMCEGEKIEVKNAYAIDICKGGLISSSNINIQDIMDGMIVGDGTVHKASNDLSVYLCIGKDDQDYFTSEISSLILKDRREAFDYGWEVKTTIIATELPKTYDRYIPERFLKGDYNKVVGFLRGLYSANGSVVSTRITLKASSFRIIREVQQMLSSIGISSYYTTNKSKCVEFSNGVYECRQSYDLNITVDRRKFREMIGFIQPYKSKKLDDICLGYRSNINKQKITYEIKEIISLGKQEVYDISVDDEEHTYWTGGLLVSNCSELPLSEYDSCRLISINLKHFVSNKFSKDAFFDFNKFSEVVKIATRLSDDLVDLEIEKLEKILNIVDEESEKVLWNKLLNACKTGRRIGLGTHGLADCIACLEMKYDSNESLDIIGKIYEILRNNAYGESVNLSEQRGSFPLFDWEKEKNNFFIKRLPEKIQKDIQKRGRRNISLLTNAPTGTVSVISQTSSGIEPVFRNHYIRRRKLNHNEKSERADFIDDVGDKWKEYKVYHHNVKEYLTLFGTDKMPDYFIESDQIDWEKRVDIQSVIQQNIDHSISSTINLPKGTTSEVVGSLYKRAWKKGLKGITVYVDGSRSGVLIANNEKKQNVNEIFPQYNAPKRPDKLLCDIHQMKFKGENWTIAVGLMEDKPYEVIGGLSKYIEVPKSYKKASLEKRKYKTKKNVYDLRIGENGSEIVIKDVIEIFDNPNHSALTRMISLGLRHGAKINYIVEQLQKDKDSDMFSFSRCIARVLKTYILDGEKPEGDKVCPECKQEDALNYKEGCVSCIHCGYSKCS